MAADSHIELFPPMDVASKLKANPVFTVLNDGTHTLAQPSVSISPQSQQLAETLDQLYDQQIVYTHKIKHERTRVEDLEFRLRQLSADVDRRRKEAAAAKRRLGPAQSEREEQRLENRLQLALNKGALLEASNENLKAEVDSVRREKATELAARRRLENQLEKTRLECAEMMRCTQKMHDQKEKTRREIELLKQEVIKELEGFQDEFRGMVDELGSARLGVQESNYRLESLVQNRSVSSLEEGSAIDGLGKPEGSISTLGGGHISQSMRLRQQGNMAYWTILKMNKELLDKATRTQELEAVLDAIQSATGPTTIEDFVPIMLEAEEENYSLFKLINELNKELEESETEKSRVSSSIEQLKSSAKGTDKQGKMIEVQEHIAKQRAKAAEYDASYRHDLEVIKSVEETLTSVFNKTAGNDEAMSIKLATMGLNERNIMTFLGLLEQRIEHVVQIYNAAIDGQPTINTIRRPSTPVVDPSTGIRVPSLKPPNPPSSEAFDDSVDANDHTNSSTGVQVSSPKESNLRLAATVTGVSKWSGPSTADVIEAGVGDTIGSSLMKNWKSKTMGRS